MQQKQTIVPSVQAFAEVAQKHSDANHGNSHGASCMTSGNRVQPAVDPAPIRATAQIVPPAHPVEQRGVNPSPKAFIQYARTVPGWPVEPRPQPGFAEDLSFPQRIQFDERSVPCGGKNNRWVDAMLGRIGLLRLDTLLRVQLEL